MQLSLFSFDEKNSYQYEDYILLEQNRHTYNMLMNNNLWDFFLLYGPLGSGKTHVAHIWQKLNDAIFIDDVKIFNNIISLSNAFIIEDIDKFFFPGRTQCKKLKKGLNEIQLLHCYNYMKEHKKTVLFTSSTMPQNLKFSLKDLESRILSTMTSALALPDEELLKIILIKKFTERDLQVDLRIINFILNNSERSFTTINRIVKLIDSESMYNGSSITMPFVRSLINKID